MDIEKLLKEIEVNYENEPDAIWQDLKKGDLLYVQTKVGGMIVRVRQYIKSTNIIRVDFVYSLSSDTFYPDKGFEYPFMVERWANVQEVKQLNENIDYLTYISNE